MPALPSRQPQLPGNPQTDGESVSILRRGAVLSMRNPLAPSPPLINPRRACCTLLTCHHSAAFILHVISPNRFLLPFTWCMLGTLPVPPCGLPGAGLLLGAPLLMYFFLMYSCPTYLPPAHCRGRRGGVGCNLRLAMCDAAERPPRRRHVGGEVHLTASPQAMPKQEPSAHEATFGGILTSCMWSRASVRVSGLFKPAMAPKVLHLCSLLRPDDAFC